MLEVAMYRNASEHG